MLRFAYRLVLPALVAVAVLWALGRVAGGAWPAFAAHVEAMGPFGPLVFVAGYVVATVAMVPASVLTLAAGAMFGLLPGTALALTGATLGAAIAFLVSRHLARPAVEGWVLRDGRIARMDQAIGRQGFKVVFLLRLSPALPVNVMNYALGLTRVRFRHYLLASPGMLPGTLLYVYFGVVAGDIAALMTGAGVPREPGYYLALALGLLATVVLTVLATRVAGRALQEEEQADGLAHA